MSEIVNLRRERKRKARAAEAGKARENRARFGRTTGEKKRDASDNTRSKSNLDGHKIDNEPNA